jgi:peptidoglycan/xylan/chitin deacetylase (PgdA/CDA1 family)
MSKAMPRSLVAAIYATKLLGVAIFSGTAQGPLAVLLFFGPDLFLFYQIFMPSARILCPTASRFRASSGEIWLTIDDGPDPEDTPRILDLLDRHRARATFFLIGARAASHPELVAEIVRRGHEVGCHTQTHPVATFWCASPRRVRAEIDDALGAMAGGGAARVRWFRAPAGIKNFFLARTLTARGLRCVGWSVRSFDCGARVPGVVAARVLRQVRPGAIVLMHEGPSLRPAVRVAALTLVLKGLEERGLACVLPAPEQLV